MRASRFIATVIKAALAALAFMPRMVWEGGKWVIKEVAGAAASGSAAAAQAQAAAEIQAAAEEVAAAKAAPTSAVPTSPVGTPDWTWGTAALAVLAGDRGGAAGILDEAALSYLDGLSADQGMRLAAFPPDRIGRHLTGNEPIQSLPQAQSLHAYWGKEIQRLCDEGAAEEALARPRLRVNPRAGLDDDGVPLPIPAFAR